MPVESLSNLFSGEVWMLTGRKFTHLLINALSEEEESDDLQTVAIKRIPKDKRITKLMLQEMIMRAYAEPLRISHVEWNHWGEPAGGWGHPLLARHSGNDLGHETLNERQIFALRHMVGSLPLEVYFFYICGGSNINHPDVAKLLEFVFFDAEEIWSSNVQFTWILKRFLWPRYTGQNKSLRRLFMATTQYMCNLTVAREQYLIDEFHVVSVYHEAVRRRWLPSMIPLQVIARQ